MTNPNVRHPLEPLETVGHSSDLMESALARYCLRNLLCVLQGV